jgi:hypothetical protein
VYDISLFIPEGISFAAFVAFVAKAKAKKKKKSSEADSFRNKK